jgi:hypothetical protein
VVKIFVVKQLWWCMNSIKADDTIYTTSTNYWFCCPSFYIGTFDHILMYSLFWEWVLYVF